MRPDAVCSSQPMSAGVPSTLTPVLPKASARSAFSTRCSSLASIPGSRSSMNGGLRPGRPFSCADGNLPPFY